ncbi:MAG: peptide chain release factor N(5)-glutamine methyltransferase [Puniceicoccales bacterium]|nr:peptide chain release factor N(5)-glutamine methyltransferase [Puniceicoccales bacterium]
MNDFTEEKQSHECPKTAGECICWAAELLAKSAVENARADAEWLLSHALNCKRMDLYIRLNYLPNEEQREQFINFLHRRCRREPLQYILGTAPFCGFDLVVDRRVLIPRPETEELIAAIRSHCEEERSTVESILDLGTGSGAIIIALGKLFPHAALSAGDIDGDALRVAAANAECHSMKSRITFLQSNWFSNVNGLWSLIVSNPPYLSHGEVEQAECEVKDHEPRWALCSAGDGSVDIEIIMDQARKFLHPNGILALEMGSGHREKLNDLAKRLGYSRWKSFTDQWKKPRFFILTR